MEGTIGLAPHPSSSAEARSFVRAGLLRCGRQDILDDALLLTSKLVTNASCHARTGIVLELHVGADGVRVAVSDESADRPHKRRRQSELESGRGLLLVDVLADSWGVVEEGLGKAVWFQLA